MRCVRTETSTVWYKALLEIAVVAVVPVMCAVAVVAVVAVLAAPFPL